MNKRRFLIGAMDIILGVLLISLLEFNFTLVYGGISIGYGLCLIIDSFSNNKKEKSK